MSAIIHELLQQCREAHARGADFPTIWQNIIRPHWLVRGSPMQHYLDGRPVLVTRLTNGHVITFDGNGFEHRESID